LVKALLQRLAADEIAVEQAASELAAAVQEDARLANAALACIKVERGARRLSDVTCSRLSEAVYRGLEQEPSPPEGDPDAGEPGATVLAGAGSRGAPAQSGPAESEPESTVFGPPAGTSTGHQAGHAEVAGGQAQSSSPDGGVDLPVEPAESATATDEADAARGGAPPSEAAGEGEDEDAEQDPPTVIARLAKSRYASAHSSPPSSTQAGQADNDGESEPGLDGEAGSKGGSSSPEAPGVGAGDGAEADDDEAEPQTVIARLAKSRYTSQTQRQAPSSPREDAPAPKAKSIDSAAIGEDEQSDGSADDRGTEALDPQEAARAASELEHADRDNGRHDSNDEEAPTVVAQLARDRYAGAARETGREPPESQEGSSAAEPSSDEGSAESPSQPDAPSDDASKDDEGKTELLNDHPEPTSGFASEDESQTEVLPDRAPPAPKDASGPDTDSSAGRSTGSGSGSGSGAPSWTPPGAEGSPELQGLGPGSVIKDRFVLEKVLGSGGMGKVYQARDQLKVEARDRNPYVAMKVLTEDFKEHPEAFIALQRESSRQQRLAHPNIATVYDFDRIGKSGTQVFITMELMEGYPLNTYLKKKVKPRGGLPPEEALGIIRQLGAALGYAHRRDIVHSDFKPGNCFLCNDGTVKVLDFGIARAVKHQGSSEGGGEAGAEKTYFDPGQLGALTPAYASLEMLEGEAPDPRDDIYALACVSYELLTGHHPYGRKSAAQARAAGLSPAPIKTLKRRQWRGLMRGLAFHRDNRSPDVDTFVEELEGRLNWHKNPYVIGGALAAALAIAGVNPLLDYLEERRIQRMVTEVQNGDAAVIKETLNELPELEPRARQAITEEARATIQGYFEQRIDQAVAPEQGRYDFGAAEQTLTRARQLYPDSQALADLERSVASARDKRLNELNQALMGALQDERLLERQGEPDAPAVPTVLKRVETVDADHELLSDPRIAPAYASAAQGAINTGELELAQSYIDTGEQLTPTDDALQNARDRLTLAREQRQRNQRIETLRERFEGRLGEVNALADLRQAQDAITDLARLGPDDPILEALRGVAEPIAAERAASFSPSNRSQAEAFVSENRALLAALGLHEPIARALLQSVPSGERQATRQRLLDDEINRLDEELTASEFDPAWRGSVRQTLGYIEAVAGPQHSALVERSRKGVARAFAQRARALQDQDRYSLALAVLDRARALGIEQRRIADTRSAIESARQDFLRERQRQAKRARLDGLKQSIMIQARAGEVEAARETLASIRPKLDDDDPFLSVTVPEVLGQAYTDAANAAYQGGDYERALELANAGLELAPNSRKLQNNRQEAKVEVNIAALEKIFRQQRDFDTARVSRMINEVRAWAPNRYQRLKPDFIELLAGRIEGMGQSDRRAAERLATRAGNVFPGSARLAQLREDMAPDPWPESAAARAALSAGRLSEAQSIVDEALAAMPEHPEVNNFQSDLQKRKGEAKAAFQAYQADLEADNLDQARDHLAEARSAWVDNDRYREAQSELSARIAKKRRQQSQVLTRATGVEGLKASGAEIVDEDWQPIASPRPCTRKLAGHGPRARAVCFDLIHERVRGPLMVVVPGDSSRDAFAISRYEISNEDYNKYCFLSGECPVGEDAAEDLPKTGLSLQAVQDYVDWLSQRTGKSYRLPTRSEWVYAARAGGEQPPRDFNCRVTLGDSVLKGTGLIDVTAGHHNGWGLKNYIGNAQELVRANGEWVARGGAFRDPHADCSYELERPYDDGDDGMTGFRVVREEVASGK